MRITILLVLLACLAISLVSASKGSMQQPGLKQPPRKTVGQAVETPKRVKRQVITYRLPRRFTYYNPYVYPTYYYL